MNHIFHLFQTKKKDSEVFGQKFEIPTIVEAMRLPVFEAGRKGLAFYLAQPCSFSLLETTTRAIATLFFRHLCYRLIFFRKFLKVSLSLPYFIREFELEIPHDSTNV